MSESFDVLIVGGGLVGASLACALDGSGLRVGMVEAVAAKASGAASYDERHLALARVSVDALQALGVWGHVAAMATPIEHVQVSRSGEFGNVRMSAADYQLKAFGAVLPARELGNGLNARLQSCVALRRFCPARCVGFEAGVEVVSVDLELDGARQRLTTRLLVGADGTESAIRAELGLSAERHDYAQTAFVTTVTPGQQQHNRAYERFTDSGAVALLPLSKGRSAVIWTVPNTVTEQLAALPDAEFLAALQDVFGYRLGRLSRLGRRTTYPLQSVRAGQLIATRAVLLGNAAQTLHPIAAQGFNLGLRDALTLAELLRETTRTSSDPGAVELLQQYAQRRAADRQQTIAFSDGLVRVFGNPGLALRLLSSFGLFAVERLGPLKATLVRHGMGYRRGRARPPAEAMT